MNTFEFKKLEIKPKGTWYQRNAAHIQKTLIYSLIGAVAGFALYYFTEGKDYLHPFNEEALRSTFMGLGLGIFLTNSPCARGRC